MTSTAIVHRRRRTDRARSFAPNQPDGRTWINPDLDAICARLLRRRPSEPEQVNGRARISLDDAGAAA